MSRSTLGKLGPDGRDVPSTRPLLDKLGVKAGARVSIVGLEDAGFRKQLEGRGADVSLRVRQDSDLIFFYMEDRRTLPRLAELRGSLKPAGALWALWPKGRKEFREDDIRASGLEAGLVDVKVVAFSETLSALKMVIPVAQRPRGLTPLPRRT